MESKLDYIEKCLEEECEKLKIYANKDFWHDAVASITGRLTYNNLFSFLYDVSDYMVYAKNGLLGRLKKHANEYEKAYLDGFKAGFGK